eukprot:260425_1
MGNKHSKLKKQNESIKCFEIQLFGQQAEDLLIAFVYQNVHNRLFPMNLIDLIKSFLTDEAESNIGVWTFNDKTCRQFIKQQSIYHPIMQFNVQNTDITFIICGKYEYKGHGIKETDAYLHLFCKTLSSLKKINVQYIVFYYQLTVASFSRTKYTQSVACISSDTSNNNGIQIYKYFFMHIASKLFSINNLGNNNTEIKIFIDILSIHYNGKNGKKHYIRCIPLKNNYEYCWNYKHSKQSKWNQNRFSERFANDLFYLQ